MGRSLSEDLHDPELFAKNPPGEYTYGINSVGGKYACGTLAVSSAPQRDGKAQAAAGGENRRGSDSEYGVDDGGHLIAAYFGGASGPENLTAQDRNLNRSTYKAMERSWADHVKDGDKVFVYVDTDRADRPTAYMGYVIYEKSDGTREADTFHMVNESKSEIAKWEEDAAKLYSEVDPDEESVSAAADVYSEVDRDEETASVTAAADVYSEVDTDATVTVGTETPDMGAETDGQSMD